MDIQLPDLIEDLQLRPHPEGGFYRETFRSETPIQTQAGTRSSSTAIYYLLPSTDFSAWHRVQSDEVWHHYRGQALRLHLLDASGYRSVRLGGKLEDGEQHQFVVPAGCWQAAEVVAEGYALCGCTVAPGFDFADFEMGTRDTMIADHPNQEAAIASWLKE